MSEIYGMRRANGDWFALDDHPRLRAPRFRSSGQAMRMRNSGMLLFGPVALDGRVIDDLPPAGGASAVYFWLVDKPSENLKRGRAPGHAQLALLGQDPQNNPGAASLRRPQMNIYCHNCRRSLHPLNLRCPYCHRSAMSRRHIIAIAGLGLTAIFYLLMVFD